METPFHLNLNLPASDVLAIVAIILFVYMSLCFFVAKAKNRADIADIAWGFGFIIVSWASQILGQISLCGLIVNILVTIWATRLILHIYFRNRNKEEDFRYQALKSKWKKHFNFKLFSEVFLLQGCILYIVSLPIMWIHTHTEMLSLEILGIAFPIWLTGFTLETLADRELMLFQKDPAKKGQLLTTGVWGYVRHPNYLGELMQWWAIWLMAAPLPFSWALLISPLLLTFLIVQVSGIKPLEEKMKKHADFWQYAEKTPSLVPPSLVNGFLYGIAWLILINYGAKGSITIPLIGAICSYSAQLLLFAKFDKISFNVCLHLSLFATAFGLLQEMILIHFGVLAYPNASVFPPLWLLMLYPLFSLTLNSSLQFLNKNLALTFFLGGFGGMLSYISGEKMGAVQLLPPLAYPTLFLSWGLFLTLLIICNRKLIRSQEYQAKSK